MENDFKRLKEYVGKRLADVQSSMDDHVLGSDMHIILCAKERAYADIMGMIKKLENGD